MRNTTTSHARPDEADPHRGLTVHRAANNGASRRTACHTVEMELVALALAAVSAVRWGATERGEGPRLWGRGS
ncbi:hypothetical protein G3A49_17395 [Haloferax volcanii]|uniref:Uncharacterized protein n=2 Tax=Haloferax volcanii TaxID=2246 RepID=M0H4V3_HALL2|nr:MULTISPECIES: hypothetical protein [Haloferax]ELZ78823.1 hypothetical protein C456_00837 [Haloferax lucentense DSM 14919]QIB79777.1 hypothetical protein G3A49_17395 [Haloferax alexandrinus]